MEAAGCKNLPLAYSSGGVGLLITGGMTATPYTQTVWGLGEVGDRK